MRAAGGKAAARRVEDEDRVVYRDLAEPAGARSLLFSPDPPRRPGSAAVTADGGVLAQPKGIFQQQPLFHLGAALAVGIDSVAMTALTLVGGAGGRWERRRGRRGRVGGREPVRVAAAGASGVSSSRWRRLHPWR